MSMLAKRTFFFVCWGKWFAFSFLFNPLCSNYPSWKFMLETKPKNILLIFWNRIFSFLLKIFTFLFCFIHAWMALLWLLVCHGTLISSQNDIFPSARGSDHVQFFVWFEIQSYDFNIHTVGRKNMLHFENAILCFRKLIWFWQYFR